MIAAWIALAALCIGLVACLYVSVTALGELVGLLIDGIEGEE